MRHHLQDRLLVRVGGGQAVANGLKLTLGASALINLPLQATGVKE